MRKVTLRDDCIWKHSCVYEYGIKEKCQHENGVIEECMGGILHCKVLAVYVQKFSLAYMRPGGCCHTLLTGLYTDLVGLLLHLRTVWKMSIDLH